jgi:hypothetical protein
MALAAIAAMLSYECRGYGWHYWTHRGDTIYIASFSWSRVVLVRDSPPGSGPVISVKFSPPTRLRETWENLEVQSTPFSTSIGSRTMGFYIGHLDRVNTQQLFDVPAWFLVVLPLVFSVFSYWQLRRFHRPDSLGHCPACGYDLRATEGRCPECGTICAAAKPRNGIAPSKLARGGCDVKLRQS